MFRTLLLFVLCLSVQGLSGGIGDNIWFPIKSSDPKPLECSLVSTNSQETIINVNITGYYLKDILVNGEAQKILRARNSTPILEKGSPDLCKIDLPILMPNVNGMNVEVVCGTYEDIPNILIAPSKGNLTRDIDPTTIPYAQGSVYLQDGFYPYKVAAFKNDPYIIRDTRGQSLWIYPFQYNPITKVLRVYSELTVKLTDSGAPTPNPLIANNLSKYTSEFKQLQNHHYFNVPPSLKYNIISEDGEMLIISHSSFITEMQPFIEWKTLTGMKTTIVDINTIGADENSIKNYIQNYYNSHNLGYVLLVGDHEMVPSSFSTTANGYSDVAYGYTAGDDHYPDVFVGRFSGETVAHIRTQVSKVLAYERDATTDQSFYAVSAFIASDQGAGIGDDGQIDWEHSRDIRSKLLDYTYTAGHEFYDGSQNGEDAPGNPNAMDVVQVVEDGLGVMWYTGHGFEQGCSTSGISSSEVSNMDNVGKLPFFWSVACVNGDFVGKTCFAEAWLRATHNNQPSGAIATLMSSINQAWAPPMEGQDEMAKILTEIADGNIKRSFGGISYNGCAGMNDAYGLGGYEMTDSWNCFGDPSFIIRTKTPETMTASHNPTTMVGTTSFEVTCDTEGAKVSMVKDGMIIAVANVVDGIAVLNFEPLNTIGNASITVTGFNKIPIFSNVNILPAQGTHITTTQNPMLTISGENGNYIAEYNEVFTIDLSVQNIGNQSGQNIVATLTEESDYVNVLVNSLNVGTVNGMESINFASAFLIQIGNNVPDQSVVNFTLTFTDSQGNSWITHPTLTISAPALEILSFEINDIETGNGNLIIDQNEEVEILVMVKNNGHSTTLPALGQLIANTSNFILSNEQDALGPLTPDGSIFTANFIGVAQAQLPASTTISFNFEVLTNSEYNVEQDFETIANIAVENFESADFNQYDWNTTNTISPWVIDNQNSYEGNECARSGSINDNETSSLYMSIDVAVAGTISFYKKVSSEQDYDYLLFYIDNEQQAAWSGNIEWAESSFSISAGEHILRWDYVKDQYINAGADAAWIDFIKLPILVDENACVAEAGSIQVSNNTISDGESISVTASGNTVSNEQIFLLTTVGPTYNIIEISDNPYTVFSPEAGNYIIGSLNYNPQDAPVLPAIGQSALGITGGCYDLNLLGNSGIAIQVESATLTEQILLNGWQISPIPAKKFVNITLYQNFDGEISLELYDLTGREVFHEIFFAKKGELVHPLSLTEFSEGIYLLNVRTMDNFFSGRVIKQ